MNSLVIIIELLIGNLTISITDAHIITYWNYFETQEKMSNVSILDKNTNWVYKFDAQINIIDAYSLDSIQNEQHRKSKPQLIDHQLITDSIFYLNQKSEKFRLTYTIDSYQNDSKKTTLLVESIFANNELINQYLQDSLHRSYLPFIGVDYSGEDGKYKLASYEVTHAIGDEHKVLIFSVNKIYEDNLSKTFLENHIPKIAKNAFR